MAATVDYVGTRIHPTIYNRGAVADPAAWVARDIDTKSPEEIVLGAQGAVTYSPTFAVPSA